MNKTFVLCYALLVVILTSSMCFAQETGSDAAELAKKLANPVASMISVPFQNNTDVGIGVDNGSRNTLNIQPVIPITLSEELNVITRVILPVIAQHDIYGSGSEQTGLGDAVASAFFSPANADDGLVWGAGPAFLLPIATDDLLASKKFGVGPTIVILQQSNGWTYGGLANQLWLVAGDESRPDVSQMFVQPFITYNWKSGAGIGLNAEITQNWNAKTTSVFINPTMSGVTKLGSQIVQLAVGPRIHVAAPEGTKADFGVRAVIAFVFSK